MPTINVPAELFMTHNGVDVYHVYKNDDPEQGRRQFWFLTDPWGGECDGDFDVRVLAAELDLPPLDPWSPCVRAVASVLVTAIDAGIVTPDYTG